VDLERAASEWLPHSRYAILVATKREKQVVEELGESGLDVTWLQAPGVESGDVVVLNPQTGTCSVLYRPSDLHHALLLTNRCNSYCLMCSQPPTAHEDGWLVNEAIDVINQIQSPPKVIGLTGGEPTLLGVDLARVTDAIQTFLPGTRIEILTNARRLGEPRFAGELLSRVPSGLSTWLVPLYGHADFLHDFVVQAPGAFDETIGGLLNLQQFEHAVQLRTVLIAPVLEHLPALCQFIARNLPFVREVALMAAEPIGFALANRAACAVDLREWHDTLRSACQVLRRYDVPFVFMNVPLCALPLDLRQYAQRSISDWKNVYAPECSDCDSRRECCGLFSWYEKGWRPATLSPIRIRETTP